MFGAFALAVAVAAIGLTRDAWPERRFIVLYTAPTIAAVGLWLRERIVRYRGEHHPLYVLDAGVFLLAALRTATGALPFSGHMLFFTYSLIVTPSALYRTIALAIIAETTWFKLIVWDDPTSWSMGLAMGIILGATHVAWSGMIERRRRIASDGVG